MLALHEYRVMSNDFKNIQLMKQPSSNSQLHNEKEMGGKKRGITPRNIRLTCVIKDSILVKMLALCQQMYNSKTGFLFQPSVWN